MRLNSFLKFFSRSWKKPISKDSGGRNARLMVEMLERRDLLTVPTAIANIVSTGPLDGHPSITVQYSTAMDTVSATNASNYVLLGASGINVTIDSVVQQSPTLYQVNYNGNAPLVVDNYTLFLKGDRLFDAPRVDAMAQPGQLIVANQGRNSLTVAGLPGDGTVGAASNYNVAGVGTQAANPRAVATGDLNGDGIKDLVLVNTGTNQALVYLGQRAIDGGGYNTTPELSLGLPAGATPNLGKTVVMADLDNDGDLDLVFTNVLNSTTVTDNVSIFLNQTVVNGPLGFNAGTNVDIERGPAGAVVADLDGDGFVDIAIAITPAAAAAATGIAIGDFQVNILPGDGTGTFTAGSLRRVKVGDAATGAQTPSSIAVGKLDDNTSNDLVIGAANGVHAFVNTSTGAGVFTFNRIGTAVTSAVVAVATGDLDSDGTTDIFATTTANNLEVFRNTGGGTPSFANTTFAIAAGTGGGLAVGDLDGNGRDDVVIANNVTASGQITVLRNDSNIVSTTRSIQAIAPVSSGGPLEVTTTTNHGLVSGDTVYLVGTTGSFLQGATPFVLNARTFTIVKTALNRFTLVGTDGVTGSQGVAGTITNRGIIQVVVPGGSAEVALTTGTPHGLVTGDRIAIVGLPGAANNGSFLVRVTDATRFSLQGVTTGTAGTNLSGRWVTGSKSGTMTAATRTGGAVTIASAGHTVVVGDLIDVSGLTGLSGSGGNGSFLVTSIVAGTSFTYADAGADGTATITDALWTNSVSLVATPSVTNGTVPYSVGASPMGVSIVSPTTTGNIATVVGGGAGAPVVVTTAGAHGLVTGRSVTLSGVNGFSAVNGVFNITVINATSFSLDGTGTLVGAANGTITAASRAAGSVTVTTGTAHGLVVGDTVTVAGVTGASGVFTITAVTGTTFSYASAGAPGPLTVTTGTWSGTGSATWTTQRSDANQDNLADVVVANNLENSFTFFSGGGDGTLEIGVSRSLTPTATTGVIVADVNNDGKPDIISFNRNSSSSSSKVTVMQGLSGGAYAAPIDFDARAGSNTFNNINSITAADIDNDGDLDILMAATPSSGGFGGSQHEIGFLENRYNATTLPNITAGQSFVARSEISVHDNPLQVAVGFFNQDAFLDMAIAHDGGGGGGPGGSDRRGVDIVFGNNNFFAGQSASNQLSNTPISSIVVGDFNRDGNADYIAGENNAPGRIHVRYGDGRGNFSNGGSYDTAVPNVGTLTATDLNGDGFLDIVVGSRATNLTGSGVAVLINQLGTGFGVAIQTDAVPGTGVQQVIANDVNQDGFSDVILTTTLPKFYARVESVSNQGGLFRVTSQSHGLQTGQRVTIRGSNVPGLNGTFTVNVPGGGTGNNAFDLTGSVFAAGYTNNIAAWSLAETAFTGNDNVFVMIGDGTGSFQAATPYLLTTFLNAPPTNTAIPFYATGPSYLAATSSPLINVATFTSGGNIINSNLIANGDFEGRDLNGEQGNLLGWSTFKSLVNPGSRGGWSPQTGTQSPLSAANVASPSGRFRVMLDQPHLDPFRSGDPNTNNAASYKGAHTLYQDVTIPINVTRAVLSLNLYIDNTMAQVYADGSSPTAFASLDFNATADNQQVRVDIVDPDADMLVTVTPDNLGTIATIVGNGVNDILITTTGLHNLVDGQLVAITGVTGFAAAEGIYNVTVVSPSSFRLNGNTALGNAAVGSWRSEVLRQLYTTPAGTTNTVNTVVQDLDLTAFRGRTIRLRVAAVNNRGKLIVGVDNVRLNVQFTDNTAPAPGLQQVSLRNPAFFTGSVPHTNDPTFVGKIFDNAGLAGIAYVEFDVNNAGSTGPSYRRLAPGDWDAGGSFSLTLPNISPGLNTVTVRVVDKAQNITPINLQFFMQANSVTEWEAVGPQGIDVTGIPNIDYAAVSGRITAIVSDANDPLGNSYYIGSANGGIWKTTDGGKSWNNVTAIIYDEANNPIVTPVAIGSIAQSTRRPHPTIPNQTIIDTTIMYAGTGVGDQALDSRPGIGVLKSTDGGATWRLLSGSITPMQAARTVKVVVDQDNPNIVYVGAVLQNGQGAVFKTTDGGLTWNNILTPVSMGLAAGTPIASVTDLIIDPANHVRLFVALGNVGFATAAASAGIWFSLDSGSAWALRDGGIAALSGATVGRLTIAMGSNGVQNQAFFYAMLSTPPGNNTPPNVNWGTFNGLYKSSNNLISFTRVMLKEDANPATGGGDDHTFVDINLLGNDAANAGALLVDPVNPNVVYVGGSRRWSAGAQNHTLIRVDTGNMAGNGDDADKAARGAAQGGFYDNMATTPVDAYVGEGVYWYDLATNRSGGTGNVNLLPPAITALALDSQGRLLVGTIGGIWRGVGYGFGYDFTSGNQGILRSGGGGGGGGGGSSFTAPGMAFSSINGNLQISSMTSVAIDPYNRGVYYTTQIDTGVAKATAPLVWTSQGLTGPTTAGGTNLGIPTAGSILTGFPPPDAPAETPISLYRVWQYANSGALIPEISTDNGATWTSVGAVPISGSTTAGIFPAFAINPVPVQLSGVWQNELLFGANQVYWAGTSGFNWDTGYSPVLSSGANITTMTFAPSNNSVIYAGTDDGKVFRRTVAATTTWDLKNGTGAGALPAFVPANRTKVNAIAVDPSDPNRVYVMFGGVGLSSFVYFSQNANDPNPTWTPLTPAMGVPAVAAYAMVIDRNVGLGAPVGKVYLATEVGVFYSLNNGATWSRLGQGMPNTPVVDLKLDTDRVLADGTPQKGLNVLAAATLGRGVYTINTSAFSFLPDQTINEDTPSAAIPFTVNDPGLPPGSYTITAASNNQALLPNGNIVLTGTGPDRTIRFTPSANQNSVTANVTSDGNPTSITVTLVQGSFVYSQTFLVTVTPVNDAPIVSAISPQEIPMNPAGGPASFFDIPFTVTDFENDSATPTPIPITVTATSRAGDQAIVPNAGLVVMGTGANRVLRITPANGAEGPVQVTIFANDGGAGGIGTRTFDLLVTRSVTITPTAFTDNFNRVNNSVFLGSGWQNKVGDFDLFNNQAAVSSAPVNIVSLNNLNAADLTVQTDIVTNLNQAGLIARYGGSGDMNMYYASLINFGSGFKAYIYKNVAGVWSQLSEGTVNFGATTPGTGTLRFEVVGTSLKLFYANTSAGPFTLVALAYDASLTTGTAGYRTTNGAVLDNYSATAITTPAAGASYTAGFATPAGNSPQLSRAWREHAGNFNATSDTLATSMTTGTNLATVAGYSQADVVVQANVTLSTTLGFNVAGLVARHTGPGDSGMYLGTLLYNGSTTRAQIYRNVGGTFTLLSDQAVATVSSTTARTLRFEVVGTSLKLFLDGTLVGFAGDSMITAAGSVGIRSYGGDTFGSFTSNLITLTNNPAASYTAGFQTPGGSGNQLSRAWLDRVGNFTATSDTTVSSNSTLTNLATVNGYSQADVAVQASVTLSTATGINVAGLVARYSGPLDGNMYLGTLLFNGSTTRAQIYRNVGGTFTLLTDQAVATVSSTTARVLRFEVVGESLKLFLDGSLVAFASDATITGAGTVGIRSYGGDTFASFTANQIVLTSNPAASYTAGFQTPLNGNQLSRAWLERSGNFTSSSDTSVASNSTGINLATVNGYSQADVVVNANVTLSTTMGFNVVGLVARYGGPGDSNMYLGTLLYDNATNVTSANIYRNVGGTFTLLKSQNIATVPSATVRNLRFEVVGDSLKLFVDNVLTTFTNDSVITTAGTVGIRSYGGDSFANFTANQIVLTNNPTASYTAGFQTPLNGNQLSRAWLDRVGNFTSTNDTTVASNSSLTNLATVNGYSQANVAVQADVTLNTTMGFNVVGLVARYGGPGDSSMYLGTLLFNGSTTRAQIYRNVGGTFTLLSEQAVSTVSSTTARTLRFEVVGTSLKLFLSNALVAFASDSVITTAGTVGIRSYGGDTFANFTANQITLASSPAASYTAGFQTPAGTANQIGRTWFENAGNFIANSDTQVTSNSPGTNLATVNGYSQANVVVNANVTMSTTMGFNVTGLVARYGGPGDSSMYLGTLLYNNTTGVTSANIYRSSASGIFTLLASQNIATVSSTTVRNLRFEVVGDSLKLFVDNVLSAFANDSVITAAGSVGIRSYNGDTFANFTADPITLTNGVVPYTAGFQTPANGNQLGRAWLDRSGNFTTTSNTSATASAGSAMNVATINGLSVADAAIQADITLNMAAGFSIAGLAARYSGASDSNMYLGTLIYSGGVTTAAIYRNVNGMWTQLSGTTVANVSGPRTVRFQVSGNSLSLFLDGSVVATTSTTDNVITAAGLVGIRGTQGTVFQNLTVS